MRFCEFRLGVMKVRPNGEWCAPWQNFAQS